MAATLAVEAPTEKRVKQTYTFRRDHGPLLVDVWEPSRPSNQPPVLLIHGWGGTGSYWRQTAFELSSTLRVIVPDLPGTGRSMPVDPPQTLFDQIETLGYILDRLEIDRVQVVGHSMGGAMALLLTDARPDQVERLVLTSLTFFMTKQQEQTYRTVMRVFRLTMKLRHNWMVGVPGMAQMLARQYFHRVPDDRKLLRQGLLDFLELDEATANTCADNATTPAIPGAGSRLQAPVMLVACRQDKMMPMENVDYTVSIIPNCEVRWIEECGHLPMVEKPDEYMVILRGFLRHE
jgi:pimeloyl-ACP methyl ester carboxylesterase